MRNRIGWMTEKANCKCMLFCSGVYCAISVLAGALLGYRRFGILLACVLICLPCMVWLGVRIASFKSRWAIAGLLACFLTVVSVAWCSPWRSVEGLTISGQPIHFSSAEAEGLTLTCVAEPKWSNTSQLVWVSSNMQVAVAEDGCIKPRGNGQAQVYAMCQSTGVRSNAVCVTVGNPPQKEEEADRKAVEEQTVYISSSGKKYHKNSDCRTLKREPEAVHITVAEELSLQPCKICHK